MARAPSIPANLIPSILLRWMEGASANAILAWIEQTNVKRAHPVRTSRSSIERIIQRACEADPRLAVGAAMERVRLNLEEDINHLEEVESALFRLAQDLNDPTYSLEELPERLRALDALARQLTRRFRLAGGEGPGVVTGPLAKNESALKSPRLDQPFPFKTSPIESDTRPNLPASEHPRSPP